MKKLVLISTFCDTQEKIEAFAENVEKFKSAGLDVMAIGPNWIEIPKEIIAKCDFFFYTKENPIITYPEKKHTHWLKKYISENNEVIIHRGFNEYGWASLYQIKKLLQFGITFDYEIYCVTIYDTVITDEMLEKLHSNKVNILHKRVNPKNESELVDSAHFMILDKNMAKLIEQEIIYDHFYNLGFAENVVKMWVNKFDLKYEEPHVSDKIYYWDTQPPLFDYQIHKDFKFFISKSLHEIIFLGIKNELREENLSSNLRLVFYDILTEALNKNISIVINKSYVYTFSLQNWEIIEIPVCSQEIYDIKIIYNDQFINFSKEYEKITFNQIYHNYDL